MGEYVRTSRRFQCNIWQPVRETARRAARGHRAPAKRPPATKTLSFSYAQLERTVRVCGVASGRCSVPFCVNPVWCDLSAHDRIYIVFALHVFAAAPSDVSVFSTPLPSFSTLYRFRRPVVRCAPVTRCPVVSADIRAHIIIYFFVSIHRSRPIPTGYHSYRVHRSPALLF